MPYFYFDPMKDIEGREGMLNRVREKMEYCCCKDYNTLGISNLLTLDEYSKPTLDRGLLSRYNQDQLLFRYQSNRSHRQKTPLDSRKLITVPQIWIWGFGDRLITAMPKYHTTWLQSWALRHITLLGEMEDELSRPNSWPQNSTDHIFPISYDESDQKHMRLFLGLVISELVNSLNHPPIDGSSDSVLRIFSKSIYELIESEDQSKRSREGRYIDTEWEKNCLYFLADMRQELSAIKDVLNEQERIWREYTYENFPACWPGGVNQEFVVPLGTRGKLFEVLKLIGRPQMQFPSFNKKIADLEATVQRTESSILTRLDIDAKFASLKEAQNASLMSAAVIGFTLVTIIFTPLSFLASLFALPIDIFQGNQVPSLVNSGTKMYSTAYIGKWMGMFEYSLLLADS
jgi:hypothetical protein